MAKNPGNLSIWQIGNAWREIMARIYENLRVELNVSPEWLVNPATNRRLKLDLLYPEIGVAVRFEGLQGKQRRQRPSLEEEAQQQQRDLARQEVCRAHGIELIVVDVTSDMPKNIFRDIDQSLSRVKERVKDKTLIKKIAQARASAASLAGRIAKLNDLNIYAELWEDRQYRLAEPAPAPPPSGNLPTLTVGMEGEHINFGPGVVLAIAASNGDTLITVDFVTAGQKTFIASLIADKLLPK